MIEYDKYWEIEIMAESYCHLFMEDIEEFKLIKNLTHSIQFPIVEYVINQPYFNN